VLLTESTRDPAGKADNYAYRTNTWNPVNGNEVRYLDGVPLSSPESRYSLIDSTPEADAQFGQAFHIFIPYILQYGYPWGRNGEVYVSDGVYLNVRAFALPYADYRGPFMDNPFTLRIVQASQLRPPANTPSVRPPEQIRPPAVIYRRDTEEAFKQIVTNPSDLYYSSGPNDIVEKIRDSLRDSSSDSLDLVLCVDATGSMDDDIEALRNRLIPMLRESTARHKNFRIGIVLYRDYTNTDEFVTKTFPFTSDFTVFQRNLSEMKATGGGDIPEAVWEALYESAVKFPWQAEERRLILIGDAPPHPRPKGKIGKSHATDEITLRNIRVSAVILPHDSVRR
jgi:hypothetical protein